MSSIDRFQVSLLLFIFKFLKSVVYALFQFLTWRESAASNLWVVFQEGWALAAVHVCAQAASAVELLSELI